MAFYGAKLYWGLGELSFLQENLCVFQQVEEKYKSRAWHEGITYFFTKFSLLPNGFILEKGWCCLVAKSCPTLCDPVDCSPPSSSVHGIFQARILEWVTSSYSRGSFWSKDQTHIFCVSCVGRQIIYHCTAWEVLEKGYNQPNPTH